jgi:hypothetical protein
MTTSERSHQDFKDAGWTCIHLDGLKVMRARRYDSYHEFFETAHIRDRYAIFSVPNGYDFFFYNEADATEFVLRWS